MSVCKNCRYFYVCGDEDRTEPCEGREELNIPDCAECCPHKEECPHAKGTHQNIWKEGIECMRADTDGELPW